MNSNRPRIAAVIPAYNEAQYLRKVLEVVRMAPDVDEIIVVDDGSKDNTWQELLKVSAFEPRIKSARHSKNLGKGQALATGVAMTNAEILLFLDADLNNLSPKHIQALVQPVVDGQADMTVGIFHGGRWNTDFSHWIMPWLSGQRCLRAEIFHERDENAAKGYGVETAITLMARVNRYRVKRIPLQGVYHPPSENHRGLWAGTLNRVKMYLQIGHAWLRITQTSLTPRRSYAWVCSAFAFMSFILLLTISYDYSMAKSKLSVENIPGLPLADGQKLLVIAPHPDDEVIGAGGLIQEILARHGTVEVVIVTNGDGQAIAPLVIQRNLIPKSANYISMGNLRQNESLAAMQNLGVSASNVIFLGYPDHGIYELWSNRWSSQCPSKGRYTRKASSPYLTKFDPVSDYCGNYLLSDFRKIFTDYLPDIIAIPHPEDEHLDHQATSNFARLALMLESYTQPRLKPLVLEYLVHYGYYPRPRGERPHDILLPPRPLLTESDRWVRLDLSPDIVAKKSRALRAHVSQIRLQGDFLPSFSRCNEIFIEDDYETLGFIEFQEFSFPGSIEQTFNFPRPQRENIKRLIISSSDLIKLHIFRLDDRIWISANTRGRLLHELNYHILIKTPDGSNYDYSLHNHEIRIGPDNLFWTSLDLNDLNQPMVLGFSAEVRAGVSVLDRTGWYFIYLNP